MDYGPFTRSLSITVQRQNIRRLDHCESTTRSPLTVNECTASIVIASNMNHCAESTRAADIDGVARYVQCVVTAFNE